MIDYDKYKGHETRHMSVASRKGSWDWVVYITENPNLEICQMFHDGIDEFNSKGEATAHLFADAPALLNRCLELEEEKAKDKKQLAIKEKIIECERGLTKTFCSDCRDKWKHEGCPRCRVQRLEAINKKLCELLEQALGLHVPGEEYDFIVQCRQALNKAKG